MRQVLIERFFTSLISGDRQATRAVLDELLDTETSAEQIMAEVFWPTLQQIQTLHRNDQLSQLSHHYATRLLRALVDQMQLRLQRSEPRHRTVMLVCGPDEPEELAAQMAADLLEASGYTVYFAGGGVANDEIVSQLGELNADVLCVFAALPSTVPFTRLLIDHLHDVGVCPKLQIAVGGGVFNSADVLAEEIGADVWARTPQELVSVLTAQPHRRMTKNQRTVGRKRRSQTVAAA